MTASVHKLSDRSARVSTLPLSASAMPRLAVPLIHARTMTVRPADPDAASARRRALVEHLDGCRPVLAGDAMGSHAPALGARARLLLGRPDDTIVEHWLLADSTQPAPMTGDHTVIGSPGAEAVDLEALMPTSGLYRVILEIYGDSTGVEPISWSDGWFVDLGDSCSSERLPLTG